MTTLRERSSNRCLRHMIYLLIFAVIYLLPEAGATTRKSLNCQVFTLYLIYNAYTKLYTIYLRTFFVSAYNIAISVISYMLCANIVNPARTSQNKGRFLSVNDLIKLYEYRYVDNYRLHQAEQKFFVQLKESTGR